MILLRKRNGSQVTRQAGYVGLAVTVALVLVGMLVFLYHMRQTSESEARRFVNELIQRCGFQHDVNFLHSVVAGDRRLAVPPGKDNEFIDTLAKLGTPDPNYTVTGGLQFDHYFFSPHGRFQSILTYADRHGTFFVNVARPSGIWLVEDYGIMWERPPD
jgi:hypothetical protein